VPVEFLCDERVAAFGRFVGEPSRAVLTVLECSSEQDGLVDVTSAATSAP
jgi:hypothetical protein